MIKKDDVFGYFMSGEEGLNGCPRCPECQQDSLVNLNNNDKITCVDPKCDWEWNRY